MCNAHLVAGEYCAHGVADSELMRFPNDISVLRLAPVWELDAAARSDAARTYPYNHTQQP